MGSYKLGGGSQSSIGGPIKAKGLNWKLVNMGFPQWFLAKYATKTKASILLPFLFMTLRINALLLVNITGPVSLDYLLSHWSQHCPGGWIWLKRMGLLSRCDWALM